MRENNFISPESAILFSDLFLGRPEVSLGTNDEPRDVDRKQKESSSGGSGRDGGAGAGERENGGEERGRRDLKIL